VEEEITGGELWGEGIVGNGRSAARREVAVVGAGPVGALLAIMLAQRGYMVDVYEARPDPRLESEPGGRSINLTLAERGWRALRAAGIGGAVEGMSLPLQGRMIHSEADAPRFSPYTASGDAIFSASRAELTRKLLDLTEDHPEISLRFGHRCCGVDVEARVISIVDPQGVRREIAPDSVLAADGAFSAVKRSLLRDPGFSFYQRLSPISYRELKVPPTAAGDFAFDPSALHLWPRGDCMIVGFPNLDRSFTVSVFMPAQGDMSFAALADRESLEEFLSQSCPDLFAVLPDVAHDFFNGLPAPLLSAGCAPWAHGGWLSLIGDAAHTIVPFLGQGLNAGFEDCSVLMECLDAAADEWEPALAAFDEARLADAEALIWLAEKHFEELAQTAADPSFVQRKAVEEKLHALAPDTFVPLYTMVAFECHPYSQIAHVRAQHEALLDRLMMVPGIAERWDEPEVSSLVLSELASLEAGDGRSIADDLRETVVQRGSVVTG
jgi:kynurenine 3-monooxygenase